MTGARGLLGSNLVLGLGNADFQVSAVDRRGEVGGPDLQCFPVDLLEPGAVEHVIGQARPDWIVHCAAMTNVDDCETNPDLAWKVNADLVGRVVRVAGKSGARLLYVSTDSVFGNGKGPFHETSQTSPANHYARTKSAGEEFAGEAPHSLVIRTNLFGWSLRNNSLAEWVVNSLGNGDAITGFTDVLFNPLYVEDLVEQMIVAMKNDGEGLYHLASRDSLSKFEFATKLGDRLCPGRGSIRRGLSSEAGFPAPRPLDTRLSVGRFESRYDLRLPDMDAGIDRFVDAAHSGWRAALNQLVTPPETSKHARG